MDAEILKTAGQIAGLAGLSLGVLLIVFREVIRKNIFPNLTPEQGYRLLRLTIVLVFLIATLGIVTWAYSNSVQKSSPGGSGAGTGPGGNAGTSGPNGSGGSNPTPSSSNPNQTPNPPIPSIVRGGAPVGTKYQYTFAKNNSQCTGEYVKISPTEWYERLASGNPAPCEIDAIIFEYTERVSNDPGFFLLYDDGRHIFARLRNTEKDESSPTDWQYVSQQGQGWNVSHTVKRMN